MSWSALGLHSSNQQYTPDQDEILNLLSDKLQEGTYFLPNVAPGNKGDMEAFFESRLGTPWATISYHPSLEMKMGSNMIRGYIIDFLAVLLLCWLLIGRPDLDFKRIVLSTLAVGFIGYLTISYLNCIWYEVNTIPELIDTFVQWGLCGIWLGYWLKR